MVLMISTIHEFVHNDLHTRRFCYVLQVDTADHMPVAVDKKSVLDPLPHIFRIGVVLAKKKTFNVETIIAVALARNALTGLHGKAREHMKLPVLIATRPEILPLAALRHSLVRNRIAVRVFVIATDHERNRIGV
jgi:hypothetical protein